MAKKKREPSFNFGANRKPRKSKAKSSGKGNAWRAYVNGK